MMRIYTIVIGLMIMILLIGCTSDSNTKSPEQGNDVELTQIANTKSDSQKPSNQAKLFLKNYKEITLIHAVNTKKDLIIAIEVHHNDRLKLTKLQKRFKHLLKNKFPKKKVKLSTDKKIILELDKLEQKIDSNKISNDTLKKEVKHLITLMNEQT